MFFQKTSLCNFFGQKNGKYPTQIRAFNFTTVDYPVYWTFKITLSSMPRNPTVNNYETGSMNGILGQLKWEFLKKRRKDNRLILLYKGLKGKASVPTDDLIPKTRRCRNQLSMAFQTPIANTDVYKGSFFPQTIRDWNALPDSLISSAEDAEDCVAKFTSLVRARD